MQNGNFNLQSSMRVLESKWKQIIAFVFLSLLVAMVTLKLVPQYYKSTAILVSANPVLADKAHLLNQNIEGLYSYFGNGDDLDRIYGIATMDTVFKQLVDEFDLINYYRLSQQDISLRRRKAVQCLKEDLSFQKTELGQLKIMVWTKEKTLSADLVNRVVTITEQKEEEIWKSRYLKMADKLNQSIRTMESEYERLGKITLPKSTAAGALQESNMHNLLEQIATYQKSLNEYKLAIENNAPALYTLEKAVPAVKAEKPDWLQVLVATALTSFLFACMLVLIYNREAAF